MIFEQATQQHATSRACPTLSNMNMRRRGRALLVAAASAAAWESAATAFILPLVPPLHGGGLAAASSVATRGKITPAACRANRQRGTVTRLAASMGSSVNAEEAEVVVIGSGIAG